MIILFSTAKSRILPSFEIPSPYKISNSAVLNGGATLFLTTLTFVLLPISSVPFFITSPRLTSNLTDEKNFSARPPGVVSGLPYITPTFSLSWLIKITTVPDFEMTAVSFLRACDISLANKPTWLSPTITSSAPLRTSASAISKACSPVSGCATIKLSISTPNFFAYTGSKACSASINAASPPIFCASATT